MARGVGKLILAIALMVSLTPYDGVAQTQKTSLPQTKSAEGKTPALPPLQPKTRVPPVFCGEAEKAALLAELKGRLAQAQADARELQGVNRSDLSPDQLSRLDAIISQPEYFQQQIAKAEAQGVTDCTKLKNLLPKPPTIRPAPWSKGDRFCTQAALDAYRREIEAAMRAAKANLSESRDYLDAVQALQQMAHAPGSPLATFKDQIDQAEGQAFKNYAPLGREAFDLEAEDRRARELKVEDYSEHYATPQGGRTGSGGQPPLTSPGGTPTPQTGAGGQSPQTSGGETKDGATSPANEPPALPPREPSAPPPPPRKPLDQASAISPGCDQTLVAVVNQARADPAGFADSLLTYRTYFHGVYVSEPGQPMRATTEGVVAVDDAIADLRKRKPEPPVELEPKLDTAASRLAEDLGPKGGLGHTGSDGSTLRTRMQDAGVYASVMEEDVSLMQTTAIGVVRQLIVDDGVPSRGHRDVVFNPDLKLIGFGGAPHKTYGTMCVLDFAGGFMSQPPAFPSPPSPQR